MSSMHSRTLGNRSDTGRPHLPPGRNVHGLPRRTALVGSWMKLVLIVLASSTESAWPLRFVSSGLGSKVSTWLTPPCMKR